MPLSAYNRVYIFDDVINLIGITAACHLAHGWGGDGVYIPQHVTIDHPIALKIGIEAAEKLAEQYGGNRLEIPSEYEALRRERERRICIDLRAGQSLSEVARRYGYSHRSVRNICRRYNIARPPNARPK